VRYPIKHANPCRRGGKSTIKMVDAYTRAVRTCDRTSAFGGNYRLKNQTA